VITLLAIKKEFLLRLKKLLTERKTFFLFLLECLSLGAFVWQWILFNEPIQPRPSLFFSVSSLLLALALSALFLYGAFFLFSRWMTSFASQNPGESSWALSKILLPLLFLPLDLVRHFIFLREIRFTLLMFCPLGILYLQFFYLTKIKKRLEIETILEEKPFRSLPGLVFILTLLVYTLYSSGLIFKPQPLTGDEPHYLIIAQSLVTDTDINVRNNYENRDYSMFYPGPLDSHRRPGKKGDEYQYSRHTPALPLLLSPFYWAADKLAGSQRDIFVYLARFPMTLMAALLSLFVFLSALRLTGKKKTSLIIWPVFSFSSPLLFYSHLIYPEIPAALILILIFYFVISSEKTTPVRQFLAGAGLGFLPWLGIKYTALTAVVLLVLLYQWWKSQERKWSNFMALLAPLVLSGLMYFTFLWSLYGSLSPFSLYKWTTANVEYDMTTFFHFRLFEFFRCAAGYLFDQRVGLIVYAPVYILFLGGLYLALKSRNRAIRSAVLIFSSYWTFCSLGYYWGGYCPPGRTLLPVLWIAALILAQTLSRKAESLALIRRGLIAMTILFTFLLLQNPWLLYHDQLGNPYSNQGLQSHILSDLSNSFIDLTGWVPALSYEADFHWPSLVVWILVAAAISALVIFRRQSSAESSPQQTLNRQLVPVFLLGALAIGYVFFNVHLDNSRAAEPGQCRIFFQDENTYGQEEGGFWVKGKSGTLILVRSAKPAGAITVQSSSPSTRKTSIRIGSSKRQVVQRNSGEETSMFIAPVGFPWKGQFLYAVQIREKSGFFPFRMDRRIRDSRFLGVFIQIEVIEEGER
jgi:hypothetical protein